MDPLTAIGLVSNILSFIDFSARLLNGAIEVHNSRDGVLEENKSREIIVGDMQRMSARLLVTEIPGQVDEYSNLNVLAKECHELSTQLILLLEKIKPKDSGSKAQSFLSALRNKTYDSERASLETRLNSCRGQLDLQLNHLTRKETLEKLEDLLQASKNDESKLEKIGGQIEQLRESISLASHASEAKPMLMTLLSEEEQVFKAIAHDRILKCLSFDSMNRRSDMVVETHNNTYEWILKDEITAETAASVLPGDVDDKMDGNVPGKPQINENDDMEKVLAREKLSTWLTSKTSHDVFHLSGKLGSGKSTLMKFIRASPRTQERLNTWADGRKLTIAGFYFWNIGSDHDKSLRGLYTSLLHQIFKQCPDLVSKVWPSRWAQAYSAPWLTPKDIEISERDITEALFSVMDSHDLLERHCFAFFIDGLDEFQSTVRDDHRDLVKLLCNWAASARGNVKVCVSSREHPVFMDGFTSSLRIRLHFLTRRDMDTYIRDKLEHASSQEGFESLVSLIMDKAHGVFLWVALVVKSLREGLENGMSCTHLKREADVLPEQMESLYSHILNSMGGLSRRRAFQTFSMMMELKKYDDYRMSLLAYSFLEEYETGSNYFTHRNDDFPMSSLTGDNGKDRATSTSRRLAGWCKGLVEPYTMQYRVEEPDHENPCVVAWKDWAMELDFAHRSVFEFLELARVQLDSQLVLRDFDHVDAILNLIVSDLLFENTTSLYNTHRSGSSTAVILGILEYYNMNHEPYTYLERVRGLLAAGKHGESVFYSAQPMAIWLQRERPRTVGCVAMFVGNAPHEFKTSGKVSPEDQKRMLRSCYVAEPLHILTWVGLCDYPLWCISKNSEVSKQSEITSLLASCCLTNGTQWLGQSADQSSRVFETLLERGWLSPDTVTNYRPSSIITGPLHTNDMSGFTLWQTFLVLTLSERYSCTKYTERHNTLVRYQGKLFQLFLRFRPDTTLSFTISVDRTTKDTSRWYSVSLGRPGLVVKIMKSRASPDPESSDVELESWPDNEIGPTSEDGTAASLQISLGEFVENSEFDNKDIILQMLDEQSKLNIGVQTNTSNAKALMAMKEGCIGDESALQGLEGLEGGKDLVDNASSHFHPQPAGNIGAQHAPQWIVALLGNEYFRLSIAALTGAIIATLFMYIREIEDITE